MATRKSGTEMMLRVVKVIARSILEPGYIEAIKPSPMAIGIEINLRLQGVCMEDGVQRMYAPTSICFGCGPANEKGLRIDSHRCEEGLELRFTPDEEHQAFPGMINGGIIGTLLDCHGNWTAAVALMDENDLDEPPCTVTAKYTVKLRRPTPLGEELHIIGRVEEISEDRATISMTMTAAGKVCATGSGLFVAVKEGHPAYHRWS